MADINVWLALSYKDHSHSGPAWQWFHSLRDDDNVFFCRLSQLGLLRLLTTPAVMGKSCLTLRAAWDVYDGWLRDPHIGFRNEPFEVDTQFRFITVRLAHTPAPKALADCYLLAMSQAVGAKLVTFDSGLNALSHTMQYDALLLR